MICGLVVYNIFKWEGPLKTGDIKSLVILPFDNFTGDDNMEYFVAGMHSSLIGDMGRIKGLRIISKTSANSYKDQEKPLHEIASDLMVDGVVYVITPFSRLIAIDAVTGEVRFYRVPIHDPLQLTHRSCPLSRRSRHRKGCPDC